MQASSVPNLSLLNAVDIRVKMMITALASVITVAISSLYAQCFLFAVSFLYLLMIRRPKLILVSYLLFLIMMAIACGFGLVLAHFLPMMGKSMELKSLAVPVSLPDTAGKMSHVPEFLFLSPALPCEGLPDF